MKTTLRTDIDKALEDLLFIGSPTKAANNDNKSYTELTREIANAYYSSDGCSGFSAIGKDRITLAIKSLAESIKADIIKEIKGDL